MNCSLVPVTGARVVHQERVHPIAQHGVAFRHVRWRGCACERPVLRPTVRATHFSNPSLTVSITLLDRALC